jgi:hypothetical protein
MSINKFLFAIVVGTATVAPACGPAHVQVGATVTPHMAWVAPGVWVVEDYPFAVYYADGYYWRYAGGIWHRSEWYEGGFVRVEAGIVPRIVIATYRPHVHVRFRAPAHVDRRPIVRDHRRPVVRDHRRRH